MQVAGFGSSTGYSVFRQIIRNDGIPGIFRGFGTSAVGSLPGRVLALTSLEMSKDMMLKYTESMNMPEATRAGVANGFAGMISNLASCAYFVPLDVVCIMIPFQQVLLIFFHVTSQYVWKFLCFTTHEILYSSYVACKAFLSAY